MPLAPGSTLLHYRLVEPIGEGGMGVVWRATDTTLGRDVALKLMLDVFSNDPERLARFEREARTLAALNHPSVAAVHGLHEADGVRFLVMELVPGEDLAERLARGPMPLEEALPVARQVAEGLEAAHARGIVHRDLKPANVKLTDGGRVKVLDFGLAKPTDPFGGASSVSPTASPTMSPTITSGGTAAGTILGTAAYMSPEQARGKAVDQRTDVWAFGCLLFEMLTGKRAFFGETVSDTLAAVLRGEPEMAALPAATPASLRRLIRRCLEKDPERRLRDLADARIEIVDALEGRADADGAPAAATGAGAVPAPRASSRARALAAAGALLLAAIAWFAGSRMRSVPTPASWSATIPEAGFNTGSTSAISPDGRWIAFSPPMLVGRSPVQLRAANSFEARPISGSVPGSGPDFSPDGRWIAYAGERGLFRVSLSGGSPQRVADTVGFNATFAWGPGASMIVEGVRIAGVFWNGLATVARADAPPERLTTPAAGERFHMQPLLLAGGKTVLFTVNNLDNSFSIAAASTAPGPHRMILRDASTPHYLATGHLLFFRPSANEVAVVRLDAARGEPVGEPVTVLSGVMRGPNGEGAYDVAGDGTLIYTPSDTATGLAGEARLVWVDRTGKATPILEETASWAQPRLSPDGARLLVRKAQTPNCDLWVRDLARGTMTRVTFEGDNHDPAWGPGPERISFAVQNESSRLVASKPWDGTGPVEPIAASDDSRLAPSWSADGRLLAFVDETAAGDDIWVQETGSAPRPFLNTEFSETTPAVSPDGRFIAYSSDESGRPEIYVRPWPGPGSRYQVSTAGGTGALWSKDGRTLYYAEGDVMMEVGIATTPSFQAAQPVKLFSGKFGWARPGNYDVTADGSRFVMVEMLRGAEAPDLRVVTNWLADIRTKLP